MRRYLELYLECVATRDNVDLLYHIAGKIKTARDRSIAIPEKDASDEEVEMVEEGAEPTEEKKKMSRSQKIAKLNSVSPPAPTRLEC
jgi:hypothetical protein